MKKRKYLGVEICYDSAGSTVPGFQERRHWYILEEHRLVGMASGKKTVQIWFLTEKLAKDYIKSFSGDAEEPEDLVTVTCYGQTKTWRRQEAIDFFLEGMCSCEGAEQEHYPSIYLQLIGGAKEARDE